ncbi:hypothetical protein BD777DRAFT_128571 [Yarrowia lipolytica]|nr:hypothetical protein BD777DRAFT_128571 [Yarrowia lipolytica]
MKSWNKPRPSSLSCDRRRPTTPSAEPYLAHPQIAGHLVKPVPFAIPSSGLTMMKTCMFGARFGAMSENHASTVYPRAWASVPRVGVRDKTELWLEWDQE